MNEIMQRRYINQYKEYYKYYNTAVRPIEEKRPVPVPAGDTPLVSWVEPGADNPLRTLKVLVGGEHI
jgi:hypothetical protein